MVGSQSQALRPVRGPLAALLAALVSLGPAGCAGAAVSTGDDDAGGAVKIGLIVPLTGPVSATGQALQRGFELGVKKVNDAGGVGGRPVTFVVADDGGNPATSTQLARKLVQQDRVSMLFGTITGDTAEAVSHVADDTKTPFGTAILGDTENCFAYTWGFGESTRQFLTPSIPELLKKYGKRVALVGSDYNYPHFYSGIAKELVAAGGGSIVAEEYSPLGQTDWQPVIGRLRDARPDVLLSMVVGADAVAFSLQAAQFGLLTPKLGYDGAPLDADYYPALSTVVNGRTHTVRWTDQLDDPESKAFAAAYRSQYQWNPPIPEVAGSAYFGIQFLLSAAQQAGADPQALNRQIGTLSFDSPLGSGTRFEPANHLLQADMLEVTIGPSGYAVTRKLGPVADRTPKKGCS